MAEPETVQSGSLEQEIKSLASALKEVNLDDKFWLQVLKSKFGITHYNQLQFIDHTIFQSIARTTRHLWEINALKKLIGVELIEQLSIQKKKDLQEQQVKLKTCLDDLKPLNDEGQRRTDALMKEKEDQLQQVLNIPQNEWMKGRDNISIDDIVTKLKSDLGNEDGDLIERKVLPAHELIATITSGQALKGILIRGKESQEIKNTILEVPSNVELKPSSAKHQNGVVQFTSRHDSYNYKKSLDIGGHNIAANANVYFPGMYIGGGRLTQKGAEENITESKTKQENTFLQRISYLIVPTGSCELEPSSLKLTEGVLQELKNLDQLLQITNKANVLQEACRKFFNKYGSHVHTGRIEFGGVYTYIATYTSETESNMETVQGMVKNILETCTSFGFDEVGFSATSSIDADLVRKSAENVNSYASSELSKVELNVTKTGGPSEVASIPLWKRGLMKYNSTWATIGRSDDFVKDFTGIWQLIATYTKEFKNPTKLAETLYMEWHQMNDITPSSIPAVDKVSEALVSFDEILNTISKCMGDDKLPDKTLEYLEMLTTSVDQICSVTDENKYWINTVSNEKSFSKFVMHIVENEARYSPTQLPHIRYLLKRLIELADDADYTNKTEIMKWLDYKTTKPYVPEILKYSLIQDIGGLLHAVKERLLPTMQIAHVCAKQDGKSTDKIDSQVTIDLALAVEQLRIQLAKSGSEYELLLLFSMLEPFKYDQSEMAFKVLLTQKALEAFITKSDAAWNFFVQHKTSDVMKLQSFLIHFHLTSVSSTEYSNERIRQFYDSIRGIQDMLTPEVKHLLTKFEAQMPYNWDKLADNLNELINGNLQILQTKIVNMPDLDKIAEESRMRNLDVDGCNSKSTTLTKDSDVSKLLHRLCLIDYYPSKISTQKVMAVGATDSPHEGQTMLPWLILRKLMMLDYNGRDKLFTVDDSMANDEINETEQMSEENKFTTMEDILSGFDDEVETAALNPLDVFLTIYSCCDLILKQRLVHKMFLCKLAVPLIIPLPSDSLSYSLWALRRIIIEWRNKQKLASECSVVSQPIKIVSFIRLGRPAISKSILLNNVISDQAYNTFWNKDCPQGNTVHSLSDGLVEAAWYIPAGKADDTFKDVTMFLNLRGDACQHLKQVELLQKISNIVVCCIDISDLRNQDVLQTMKMLHSSSIKVVLNLVTKDPSLLTQIQVKHQLEGYITHIGNSNMKNTKQVTGFRGPHEKHIDALKQELRLTLCKLLQQEHETSIEKAHLLAKDMGIDIDEEDKLCQYTKGLAVQVVSCMDGKSIIDCKTEMLPLQGHEWQKWSDLLRRKHCGGGKEMHEVGEIQEDMLSCRERQLNICENKLSTLMKNFIRNILNVNDSPADLLYLEWLKHYLDEKSRETLPKLQTSYHEKWNLLKEGKEKGQITKELKEDVDASENILAKASLGLEHLFREVAQFYEAAKQSRVDLSEDTHTIIQKFPKVAAQLLLKGEPLEIMDGDVVNVPATWVKAVLTDVIKLVKDQTVLVISIIGIQSSGKSTLLNTMFGLNLAVSAGRCTRGAYMQLLEVDKSSNLPYSYVMVIDTEGLRAPELNQLNNSHDNELATLAIGLGDITIMNFKGESLAEMADILQITVHAFLRMKIVNKDFQAHRTCVFIHQNVPAINAKEMLGHGCQRIQVTLDDMTVEACDLENIADICTFNQVIQFDTQNNVWFFSDLWYGDPPMAPVNPGYSERVREVHEFLIKDLAPKQETLLKFSDMILRIEDLWIGVLADDFVFSFRNSLEAKAYDTLEHNYYKLTWKLEKHIMEWVSQTAFMQLERCNNHDALQVCQRRLFSQLEEEANTKKAQIHEELEEFFKATNLQEILIQWKARKIECLKTDTRTFCERAKREILQKHDSLWIDLLQKNRQESYEAEIMKKAKDLAEEMKGKEIDEDELLARFNCVWIQWQNELANRNPIKLEPVEFRMEQLLWNRLQKNSIILGNELKQNPLSSSLNIDCLEGSMTLMDIEKSHISMCHYFKSSLLSTGQWPEYQKRALHEINIVLRKMDVYLSDLLEQGTNFQESHAIYMITCVEDSIRKHNQNKKEESAFTLLPNFKVKVVVHCCRHAVRIFKKMDLDYEKNHGMKSKLNEYKNTIWKLFKNIVRQSTKEVIAVDLLYDRLEEKIKKTIKERLTADVVDNNTNHFVHQKHRLLVAILDELALTGTFQGYRSFLMNTKNYVLEWITSFTHKQLFHTDTGSKTKYTNFARSHMELISRSIAESIKNSTDYVLQQLHPDMETWSEHFRLTLNGLPLQESDLKNILKTEVTDFINFQKLLMKQLPELEERIINGFQAETPDTITWVGTTPYQQTMNKLWGCDAQCPFCGEPCQRTDPNHVSENDNHQCIQHRPAGIRGVIQVGGKTDNQLNIYTCNYAIQKWLYFFRCTACRFECRQSGLCHTTGDGFQNHYYREYKRFLPDWDIAPSPSMESSKYWMWFMATYTDQLTEMHSEIRGHTKHPDIPPAWIKITKKEARDSLRHSFN